MEGGYGPCVHQKEPLLLLLEAADAACVGCPGGERDGGGGACRRLPFDPLRLGRAFEGEISGSCPAAARDDAPKNTAIKVSAIHEPFYAKASDGKVHLEYDLVSTSVFSLPLTLTKVVVVAGDGRKLLTLQGDALEARSFPQTRPRSSKP